MPPGCKIIDTTSFKAKHLTWQWIVWILLMLFLLLLLLLLLLWNRTVAPDVGRRERIQLARVVFRRRGVVRRRCYCRTTGLSHLSSSNRWKLDRKLYFTIFFIFFLFFFFWLNNNRKKLLRDLRETLGTLGMLSISGVVILASSRRWYRFQRIQVMMISMDPREGRHMGAIVIRLGRQASRRQWAPLRWW